MSLGGGPDKHHHASLCSLTSSSSASLAQLVELKNGETYNGNLVSVDQYMNLSLSDVICTSKDGARCARALSSPTLSPAPQSLSRVLHRPPAAPPRRRFWRLPTALVRGPAIKYLRIPEDVLDHMPAEDAGMAESGAFAGRGGGAAGGGGGCVRDPRRARAAVALAPLPSCFAGCRLFHQLRVLCFAPSF